MIDAVFMLIAFAAFALIYLFIIKIVQWPKLLAFCSSFTFSSLLFFILVIFVGKPIKLFQLDKALRHDYHLYQMIADQYPKQYQQFLARIKDSIFLDTDRLQIEELSFELLYEVYPKYLTKAPDDKIYADLLATLELYEKMYTENPAMILKLEFPKRFTEVSLEPLKMSDYQDVLIQSRRAKTALVEAAIVDPQPLPDATQVEPQISRIIQDLVNTHGREVVSTTFNSQEDVLLDKKKAASVVIDFYHMLLAQMPAGAGKIVRYFSDESR